MRKLKRFFREKFVYFEIDRLWDSIDHCFPFVDQCLHVKWNVYPFRKCLSRVFKSPNGFSLFGILEFQYYWGRSKLNFSAKSLYILKCIDSLWDSIDRCFSFVDQCLRPCWMKCLFIPNWFKKWILVIWHIRIPILLLLLLLLFGCVCVYINI